MQIVTVFKNTEYFADELSICACKYTLLPASRIGYSNNELI